MEPVGFISEAHTGLGTLDVEHHCFPFLRDEVLSRVVEDPEPVLSACLEELVVVVAEDIDLLLGIDGLDYVPRLAADKLDLLVV